MKIEPEKLARATRKAIGPAETSPTEAAEVGDVAGPAAPRQADQVVLSQRAAEIQMAKETLARIPEVRAEKVAELKRRIQEGTYEIDPEAVAAKIISGGD